MKKNLLQPETRAEIIARIDKLTPDTKNQWEKMNVNQMLWHTNHGLQSAMDEYKVSIKKPNPLLRGIMRFVIFKINMPTPKAKAETFGEINTVAQGINPADFNSEREALKKVLQRFPNNPTYASESPLLGKMSKKEWAVLQYGHLDHHLQQFGV